MSWVRRFRQRVGLDLLPKPIRRVIVAVIGGTLLLIGLALLVLPGPAFVVIPIGLLILATEFAWARWLLRRAQDLWRKRSTVPDNHIPAGKS
jgi:hypothetical protein